jgi:hypothetical protein
LGILGHPSFLKIIQNIVQKSTSAKDVDGKKNEIIMDGLIIAESWGWNLFVLSWW